MSRRATVRRVRRPRAVGLLWFAMIAVPFFMFASFLAFDLTRVIMAGRQARDAAEAAAVAGAFEQVRSPDNLSAEARLNQPLAQDTARTTLVAAQRSGAASAVNFDPARADITTSSNTVTVTFDYKARGVTFVGYFLEGTVLDLSVTRTADVCVPGQPGAISGQYCARPTS